MKIAVVSPNKILLNEIGKLLQAASHVAVLTEGGKDKLRQVAEQDQPELMLIDGGYCDGASLAPIEDLTTRHPRIAVVLLCGGCSPDFLINAMRAGVREVLPSPVASAELAATVNRIGGKLRGAQARHAGKVLAFIPCKGGSGATFLATSLGYQLSETRSVLLIDLNLQFGDALSFVHDGRPPSTLADVARSVERLDASFLAASTVRVAPNFSIMAAPDDHAQAVEVTPAQVDAILAVAVMHYDFVLLDLGRTIDNLSIKALDRADLIYMVMQAGLPSIRNAKKMLAIFKSLDYSPDKIELIVNRFDRKGPIGVAEIERTLGKFAIHTVPNSYKHVTAAIDRGEPLITSARSDPVLRNVAGLADAISPRPHAARGLFERLLSRDSAGAASPHSSGEPHVLP
ncbi:CpaE family protein [Massilia sp. GCM10020059]|uniref:AAA family ATPase n=1 Tax=Massilia agrisoli TaxID=2892444 RepID=A0ABS8IV45_9BURK|nr:AAA family ATPase [Massilia agrisoli]MCC6071733.1 AAA family ATPase [Massilia agrisoli]